jgi:hypothetical protein
MFVLLSPPATGLSTQITENKNKADLLVLDVLTRLRLPVWLAGHALQLAIYKRPPTQRKPLRPNKAALQSGEGGASPWPFFYTRVLL